jgi:predicted RNase H-like nuclease (RuvC/YqgF family)
MGQDVNRIPFNIIPTKWAFDPEIGPFIRELLEILNQSRSRTGGDNDTVADLELINTLNDGGNRTYRRYNDEIQELSNQLSEIKRKNRSLEQKIDLLEESFDRQRRAIRTAEQNVNELTERYDSGT